MSSIKSKKKIAFFTPLPPLKSGISDYSVDIIGELTNYYDIDIFVDRGYRPQVSFGAGVRIFPHRKYHSLHGEYFETIYQVGNSRFHSYMFPYIQTYSGILMLHDFNLQEIAAYLCFAHKMKNYRRFERMLSEDYDEETVKNYIKKLKKKEADCFKDEMPMNGFVANYAKKIIVHSNEAKQKLLSAYKKRKVYQIWLYAKIEPYSLDHSGLKEKLGFRDDDIVLASFGYIQETKRAVPILDAYKRLHEKNDHIKLLYVGELNKKLKNQFRKRINDYGLEDCVRITGYVDLDAFIRYIDITDICLNLRYPYNGETSGALMRIFAKGKSVIVNNIGSFGEFPDDICIKLPSVKEMDEEEEITKIMQAVSSLSESSQKRQDMGKAAYDFAKQNLDLSVIGKKYAECIENQ